MKPIFTISIAVHNNLHLTRECVSSILQNCKPGETEILVTDNGSTDGTADYLRIQAENKPNGFHVGVIRNEENRGFGRAHNRALDCAKGIYFLVLNNDLTLPKGVLEAMRKQFTTDSKVGICGVLGSCSELDATGKGVGAQRLDYIDGSCLMIPVWLARQEGLFSDAYRLAYSEDADLSLRLREKGWHLAQVPAKLQHQRGSTSQIVAKKTDLDGIQIYNHLVLTNRWGKYLKNRHFRQRFVFIRDSAVGDVFLMTPLIEAIKHQYAEAEITVATKAGKELFQGNPYVARVVNSMAEVANITFDRIYDLTLAYEKDPRRNIVDAYASACGIKVIDQRPKIYLNAGHRSYAKTLMPGNKWAVVHPGPCPGWPGRNWPLQKFAELTERLRKDGWKVAIVGKDPRVGHPMPHDANLGGKTTIHQLAAVIERSGLFVGLDSFPMHLAVAMLRPIVGIFGSIEPTYRLPSIPFFLPAIADEIGCVGCHHILPAPITVSKCLRTEPFCMTRLTVDKVHDLCKEAVRIYMAFTSETQKIRDAALPYCNGAGVDIGCRDDKIKPDAVGFDKDHYPHAVDVVGDARKVQAHFKPGQFDYVFSSHCLEDIADTDATLRGWLSILKKGGNIILQVPHPKLYKGCNLDHKHPGFTPEELSEMLVALGCEILESRKDEGKDRYSTFVVAKKL
jgi:ADP-heptose:LPS heptosyltransferase